MPAITDKPQSLLARIHQHSSDQGDKIAIQSDTGQVSYRKLSDRIQHLAELLIRTDTKHLGIWLDNGSEWIVCQLAAFQAGIPVTPIPTFFSLQQAYHAVSQSGVDVLITASLDQARIMDSNFAADPLLQPLLQQVGVYRRETMTADLPDKTALVTFTSGTTGTPKGVCLSLVQLDSLCQSLYQKLGDLRIEQHACLIPLAVLLENLAGVLLPLYAGERTLIYPSTDTGLTGSTSLNLQQLAKFLNKHQPQSLILTPQLLKALLALKAGNAINCNFKFIAVGGGTTSVTMLRRAKALGLPVYEGYGLSECASVVSLNTPAENRPGSAGQPLPHCQVAIAGDGEIMIHGSSMLGYLGHNPDNGEHKSAEWIASGDIGTIDEQGFLHIQGRKKNVYINSSGRNFCPEWIESELNASPLIQQACVFGDNRPFNIAIINSANAVTDAQLQSEIERINQQLPDYAQIGTWLPGVTPFRPSNQQLTANGRIRREVIYQVYGDSIE
ncbi:MAG: AMP-binding protein, partial [Motiliproteus sp.]